MQPRGALFLSLMVTNCSGEWSLWRFKRIKSELKGRNILWEVVGTKHSIRGVTRLDGARGKKLVCHPYVGTWSLSEAMYCIAEGSCGIVRTFIVPRSHFGPPAVMQRPHSDSTHGEVCLPCPQSLRPCIRYNKSDKLRQTNCKKFLHIFVTRKAGQNPFNCLLYYVQP